MRHSPSAGVAGQVKPRVVGCRALGPVEVGQFGLYPLAWSGAWGGLAGFV